MHIQQVSAVNQVIPVAFHRPRLSLWISDLHIFSICPPLIIS